MDNIYLEQLDNPILDQDLKDMDKQEVVNFQNSVLETYTAEFEGGDENELHSQVSKTCKKFFPFTSTNVFHGYVCFILSTLRKATSECGFNPAIYLFVDGQESAFASLKDKPHPEALTIGYFVKFKLYIPENARFEFDYEIKFKDADGKIKGEEFEVEVDSADSFQLHVDFYGKELREQIKEICG